VVLGPGAEPNPEPPLAGRRRLLVVDDCERFTDTRAEEWFCKFARQAREREDAIVISGLSEALALTYRGIAADVRRSRSGLLLQPGPGDGELLGIRLPRTRPDAIPGRGVLIADQARVGGRAATDRLIAIQLALPKAAGDFPDSVGDPDARD
jgi:S-DNA-T family DNA segregation ATPase FtsK/SpoIIIE